MRAQKHFDADKHMSSTKDMTQAERGVSLQNSDPESSEFKKISTSVLHEATNIEPYNLPENSQCVHETEADNIPNRDITGCANNRKRIDSTPGTTQIGDESLIRLDRVEAWLAKKSCIAQEDSRVRCDARESHDVDIKTRRAMQALDEPIGKSVGRQSGDSLKKQQDQLHGIGGWL